MNMTERPADTKAQLGCGTLIIIAIIVMIFSGGRDSSEMRDQVTALNQKIDRLETKIDELSRKLDQGAPSPASGSTEAVGRPSSASDGSSR